MLKDGPFTLQASLSGMSPEDFIRLEMPPECRQLSLSALLDRAFPASPEEQQAIASQFGPGTCNYRANPDLPGIYAVFLAACEEWRDWRCALRVTPADGTVVPLSAPVSQLVPPAQESPRLALRLEQQYCALEYAVRHGLWASREELLGWMRLLTAIYFLDKHEVLLYPGSSPATAPGLRDALASLQSQGLIDAPPQSMAPQPAPPRSMAPRSMSKEESSGDATPYAITPLGRRFIGELLDETEFLIDHYDHYKDTVVDMDLEMAEFGAGRGADLRVEAFLAQGINPIRAVFLLRLYDGVLDHRLRDWQEAIEGEEFYEGILEPVVNRDGATPEAMDLVIESGLSWLEEQQEQALRQAAEREILRRAGGEEEEQTGA